MSGGRTIAANATALTLAKGGTMMLGLATFAHLTRALEPDGYGVLAWATALFGYFAAFVELGLGALYVREVARAPERVYELAGWLFGMRLILLGGALAGLGLVVWALDRPPAFRATVAIVGVGLVGNALSLDWAYHGTQRMGRLAVRNVAAAAVTLVAALLLVHSPDDLLWAAAVTAAGGVLGSLAVAAVFVREYGVPRPRLEWPAWRGLLRAAVPIGTALFLMQVYATVDQLMLGVLRSDAEVGWYASAYRVLTAAFVVDQILQQAFLPALADAPPAGASGRALARDYAGTLALLGVPLALGAAVFADEVLLLFAGAAYLAGAPALVVLLAFAAVVYLTKSLGDSLVAWGEERLFLRAVAVAAVVNVGLNVALIPRFGAVGAAVATLASGLAVAVGTAVPYRRLVGSLHVGGLGRVVASALAGVLGPALAVRAAGGGMWVAASIAAPAYVGAALLFGAVPAPLVRAVRDRFHRSPSPS